MPNIKMQKLYLNLLKDAAGIKCSNIQLSTFKQYFKAVNNPSDPFYRPDEDIIYFNERYESDEFGNMFDELSHGRKYQKRYFNLRMESLRGLINLL